MSPPVSVTRDDRNTPVSFRVGMLGYQLFTYTPYIQVHETTRTQGQVRHKVPSGPYLNRPLCYVFPVNPGLYIFEGFFLFLTCIS